MIDLLDTIEDNDGDFIVDIEKMCIIRVAALSESLSSALKHLFIMKIYAKLNQEYGIGGASEKRDYSQEQNHSNIPLYEPEPINASNFTCKNEGPPAFEQKVPAYKPSNVEFPFD